MKTKVILIFLIVIALLITGCASRKDEAADEKTEATKEETKEEMKEEMKSEDKQEAPIMEKKKEEKEEILSDLSEREEAPASEAKKQDSRYNDERASRRSSNQTDSGNEDYATIAEGGFRNTFSYPLSTFSIDVDTASYANMRRYLNDGMLPPIDSIRVEEMINYFSYKYPQPDGMHPFSVNVEMSRCPWNNDNLLAVIGLKGEEIDKEDLPPSNLVFLLDVSGSMNNPDKLPLLKSAFRLLVKELDRDDRVSIVVYAGNAGIVLEGVRGDRDDIIIDAIDSLRPGGSTAGGQGIRLAYYLAEDYFIKGGNNRVIMATDGDFNVGLSTIEELENLIERKRETGVYLSMLGFGKGNLKDDKMETLADKGNGNYYYIDNLMEAEKVLVSEMGGTLHTIANDVKIQVEFNPAIISEYRLIGYENRALADEDFDDDTKDAGEIGSGHTVTAIYELVPAYGLEKGDSDLKYQTQKVTDSDEYMYIKLRYKQPQEGGSQLFDMAVTPNHYYNNPSVDYNFAAAVAEFGMLLRNSDHLAHASYDNVIELAKEGRGRDDNGYRAEFIRLARMARALAD